MALTSSLDSDAIMTFEVFDPTLAYE